MSYISATIVKDKVLVWERTADGKRIRKFFDAPYYFYVDDPNGEYTTIFDTKVSKLVFKNSWEYREGKQVLERERFATGITAWESDISPDIRVLSNNYYGKPIVTLNTTFVDIEVDYDPMVGFSSPENPYAPINSISMFHRWKNELVLYCVAPPNQEWTSDSLLQAINDIEPIPSEYKLDIVVCEDERELLIRTAHSILDTDIWCGYNSEMFDFPYLFKRAEIVLMDEGGMELFNFEDGPTPFFKEVEVFNQMRQKVEMKGRILTDYMQLIKKFEPGERESYKLASMEEEKELNLPKLTYSGTLADLYKNNFPLFVRYNIRDSEILEGFERKLGYVNIANTYVHMATGYFDHVLGTLRLAELTIINKCHHDLKRVVPNNRMPEIDRSIQGAFVVESVIGLHKNVASVDLTSLYPSCLRALNASPETVIGQFDDEFDASEDIFNRADKELTLTYKDGQQETRHVDDWVEHLTSLNYSVSGFGVVFDQSRPGIIPMVLTEWFTERSRQKGIMKSIKNQQMELLDKARTRGV